MLETKIKSIILKNFRNHDIISLKLEKNSDIIAFIDKNGSGKTNILEAISLLSPGSGIRGANLHDMVKNTSVDRSFLASFEVAVGDDILHKIEILYHNGKKKITLGQKPLSAQMELKNLLGMIWLSPEIQVEIALNRSARRKFFDRMVFNFHQDHAKLILDYENLTKERHKILNINQKITQNSWLDSIEKQIADISIKICKNRLDFLENINKNAKINDLKLSFDILCDASSIVMEDFDIASTKIASKLLEFREKDKHSERTNFGCHRYDFAIRYLKNGLNIDMCSSGEKKYLITSFLICVAQSIIDKTSHCPIVLIDEFTSFIDADFRLFLIAKLRQLKCQIWLTGTEIPDINEEISVYKVSSLIV
ncbi:DNA replication/repair protein RecF [Candidatus Deianiraea vastatrix]|uniref:DNA replication and repair protein RecF n=1 Tax=Candidatus Deianiraea vastatrix TaxID=2163644 RepID=A0A5B8XCP0_9RICK|nr:AAA family ATPase [Candidatus Deianiraea vastatrix]QED23139.1 DNA replication and repair protein RecF [Candidatus Deianiraea vastatrix]